MSQAERIKVALLFGGRSDEHDVSLISAASIFSHLDQEKYEVLSIYINRMGFWRLVPSPLVSKKELLSGEFYSFLPWNSSPFLKYLQADIYFPVLHGPFGEDGTIQGLFELAGVPYVGAGVLASAIGMDKIICKTIWHSLGLPVVPHLPLLLSQWVSDKKSSLTKIKDNFSFPLFVKPANLGSSVGISKVKNEFQLEQAIQKAFSYDNKILIEKAITGREIECSILGNEHPRASLPGEIIPSREFYDYQDKYLENKAKLIAPADLPYEKIKEIQDLSIKAFQAIDGQGMARVDFFLEQGSEQVYLNEINTIPGFTAISMFPKLWEVSGVPYNRLLEELIHLGFHRFQKRFVKQNSPQQGCSFLDNQREK
ncbi:D-alanine--D-alanine ligase [Candidatus Aminicenantes bacterium AC-334-K16]|jgi:D-alanine-D-alanine ligase|nr:D-alanine--D-alanine ligase [Candidatus Aminicenantes bacterium AC-334-K16]